MAQCKQFLQFNKLEPKSEPNFNMKQNLPIRILSLNRNFIIHNSPQQNKSSKNMSHFVKKQIMNKNMKQQNEKVMNSPIKKDRIHSSQRYKQGTNFEGFQSRSSGKKSEKQFDLKLKIKRQRQNLGQIGSEIRVSNCFPTRSIFTSKTPTSERKKARFYIQHNSKFEKKLIHELQQYILPQTHRKTHRQFPFVRKQTPHHQISPWITNKPDQEPCF